MRKLFFISLLLMANFVFSQGGYSPISKLRLTSTPTESNSNTQILVRDGSSGNVNYVQKDSLVGDLDAVLTKGNESTQSLSIGGVGINTTTPEAVLDVVSDESGILIPRLTSTERDAIAMPVNSMLIFNSTTETFQYYFDAVWFDLLDSGYTPTLQEVTDAGSSTTNTITITDGSVVNQVSKNNIFIYDIDNNEALVDIGEISIKNSVGAGSALSSGGGIQLRKSSTEKSNIYVNLLTDSRDLELPDSDGIIATENWVNTNSIPLSGTTEGNPLTGKIEIPFDDSQIGFNSVSEDDYYFVGIDGDRPAIVAFEDDVFTSISVVNKEVNIKAGSASRGLVSANYYGANYDDNTYVQKRYADNLTGWQQITDTTYTSGSPLTIAEGVTAKLLTGKVTSIDTQLPNRITSFWNNTTDKLVAVNDGDAYSVSIRFKAKMDVLSGYFDVGIDIGGSLGVIVQTTETFTRAANTEQRFTVNLDYFTGTTFIANGGNIEFTPINGDLEVYDIVLLITRTHKGK